MDQGSSGGGEPAAKRPNLSSSGADRISALPDDIIALILLRLDTIAESVRTSVLSRRWRRVWSLLPELTFSAPYNRRILEVLSVPEAPALRRIAVVTDDADPVDSMAAWLPIAARRLSGTFMYHNTAAEGEQQEDEEEVEEEEEAAAEKVTIALPCFRNATQIDLNLRFFGLALPSSGAFTHLTELIMKRVWFQGTCEVGDMVSSPRCPCLKKLNIHNAYGVARLTIRSESLLQMYLGDLNGLQRLDIDAPELKLLALFQCFRRNQPVANISAPQLTHLIWMGPYDKSHVQLGSLEHLQALWTGPIPVYGSHHNGYNPNVLPLVQHFQVIRSLSVVLGYLLGLGNLQYLMEDVTYLPNVTFLAIRVINSGHTFGASLFHMLRLCTGVRKLSLILHNSHNLEPQSTCPSGCICHQPTTWKTEKLSLSCLQEIEIIDVKGAKHEVSFLKRLFKWAGVLEKLRIFFNYSVSKSKAKELCQRLSHICRAETLLELYMYRDSGRSSVDLLSLEDEGTWV